jgi:hypothetical protein
MSVSQIRYFVAVAEETQRMLRAVDEAAIAARSGP